MSMKNMRQIISKSMGIGTSTMYREINEYKETNIVISPKRKKAKGNVFYS